MIVYRALKKLHLGKTAFALVSGFCRPETPMPVDEARRLLNDFYPLHESSCVRKTLRVWSDSEVDLSILVPTYNNAAYIEECIRSVLEQETQFRFELIVVNDGSTDDTAQRLQTFSDRPNVRVIHQANAGVSAARNVAIDQARGAYLLFLDGDDVLLPGAIQTLMQTAVEHSAAIVEGGYQTMDTAGKMLNTFEHKSGILDVQRDLYGFPCFKVMKRSLWQQIDFPAGLCFEDSVMAQILWEKAALSQETAIGVRVPVGGYRVNPKGFSLSSVARPCSVDTVWITQTLMQDRERLGLSYSQYYYEHLLDMAQLSWQRTAALPKEIRKAVFSLYCDFLNGKGFSTKRKQSRIAECAIQEHNFRRFELLCALC